MAGRIVKVVTLGVVLAVTGVVIVWGPGLWHRYGDRLFSTERCTATVVEASDDLTAEQANNAALIVAIGMSRGLPERAWVVALATALQESDLRNLKVGDRDSLGLFQQRPSQGWGTEQEVMDPHHATNAFYDTLVRVEGWETMSVTEAAQAVQRSGFPEAYARHEARAAVWTTALSGGGGADGVRCSLASVGSVADPAAAVLARAERDFGATVDARSIEVGDNQVVVALIGNPLVEGALPSWAVAVASTLPIEAVTAHGKRWTRGEKWVDSPRCPLPPGCAPGEVYLTLSAY